MQRNEIITSLFVKNPIADFLISGFQATTDQVVVTELKLFPDAQENRNKLEENSPVYESLCEYAGKIQLFMNGAHIDLSSIPVQLDYLSSFQKQVLTVARKIDYGSTVSYSRLAEMAGSHTAVRAAATVMRKNRYPIIIPCHRVIRANGEIGGYCGKHCGEAIELKRKLLRNEGVILE